MLPLTCLCRAEEDAKVPPSNTVSNHQYLDWTLFSSTLFTFILLGRGGGARSNLPFLALISVPDTAFPELYLGNRSKGVWGWGGGVGWDMCVEMLALQQGAGTSRIFSWACALQPCTVSLRTSLSASIKSFYSCMKCSVKKSDSFWLVWTHRISCFAGNCDLFICRYHNSPTLAHFIFCFNISSCFDCIWEFF